MEWSSNTSKGPIIRQRFRVIRGSWWGLEVGSMVLCYGYLGQYQNCWDIMPAACCLLRCLSVQTELVVCRFVWSFRWVLIPSYSVDYQSSLSSFMISLSHSMLNKTLNLQYWPTCWIRLLAVPLLFQPSWYTIQERSWVPKLCLLRSRSSYLIWVCSA